MRLAVITPFLDRKHGTERALSELLQRLVSAHACEIHLYCQKFEAVETFVGKIAALNQGTILWHQVSGIPGPHLLQYIWWFFANRVHRWRDTHLHGLRFDLIFSPGINAFDADVIHVHMVFAEFWLQMQQRLIFKSSPLRAWPLLLHRRLYYRLIRWLEKKIYKQENVVLAGVSKMVTAQLKTHFGAREPVCIPNGVDSVKFNVEERANRRVSARQEFRFSDDVFVLLLIGNDWQNKGLPCLLQALKLCTKLPLQLLVVGDDQTAPFEAEIKTLGLPGRVRFVPTSDDVLKFYACADAYVGPSIEDAYGLPVLEAMACGLPVIASRAAGVSEIIEHGVNGLVLEAPTSVPELACLIRLLVEDVNLRNKIALQAEITGKATTWDQSADLLWDLLVRAQVQIADKKKRKNRT